jgi:hypothetical protein
MAAICPGAPHKRPQLRIRIGICGKRLFRSDLELSTTPTNQPILVDNETMLRAPERPGKRRHVILRKGSITF